MLDKTLLESIGVGDEVSEIVRSGMLKMGYVGERGNSLSETVYMVRDGFVELYLIFLGGRTI